MRNNSAVDRAIEFLLQEDGMGLGTNGKTASGGSSYSGGDIARDVTRGVTDITGIITRGIVDSRRARYGVTGEGGGGDGALPASDDLLQGSGVQVTTPWGRIVLGGAAVLIIGGLVTYIAATGGKDKKGK
jgi:hypothetical protein